MLAGLDAESLNNLVQASTMVLARKGEVIWLAQSPALFCGVVNSGFVKMTRTAPSGAEMVMELLGPGQCFGLLAVIESRPYPLSALASTDVWYLKSSADAMREAYAHSSSLKDQVVRMIGPRLRRAHDMMSRLSSGRVEERLAAVLFILSDSYGEDTATGVRLEVPLTRQDLAEMSGTTTETAIRVLSKWQKAGIVSTEHHVITIRDLAALQAAMQV